MRYISSVNRCGTALLGGRACSPLVFCARLHRFGVRTQGMAIMRTLREGICQCIKYVERHLRVKCNYTDSRKFQWESYFIYYITFLYIYIYNKEEKAQRLCLQVEGFYIIFSSLFYSCLLLLMQHAEHQVLFMAHCPLTCVHSSLLQCVYQQEEYVLFKALKVQFSRHNAFAFI